MIEKSIGYLSQGEPKAPASGELQSDVEHIAPEAGAYRSIGECVEVLKLALLPLALGLIFSTAAIAQPKPGVGPSSTHIFPAGGRRGTTVSVAVGGECLPPGTRFVVSNPDIQLSPQHLQERAPDVGEASQRRYPTESPINYPKQWSSQITISSDAELGTSYWRLSCADGGTCSRPFLVGDLPEFIESESNSLPDRGQRVELPVTINGQISGERDVDYYRFEADAGDVVSCEVVARRLGSPLDANVTFHNAEGGELESERRYLGSDVVVAVAIDRPGHYLLRIANISFRGDSSHVYRLNLSRSPFVYSYFPAGGQPGTTRSVSFLAMSGTGQPVEINRAVTFPNGGDSQFTYRSPWFANDVAFELAAGENATESELGIVSKREPQALASGFASDNIELGIPAANSDGSAEIAAGVLRRRLADSNGTNLLGIPITIDGVFDKPSDVDEFSFEAVTGEWFRFHCRNHSFQSAAMPVLAVLDMNGKELANATSLDVDADCRIEWQAPADGTYRLRLRDLRFGSQGGSDFVYRMSIARARPDFSLVVSHDCINLVPDTETLVEVSAQRLGGFAAEIELRVAGLPAGVLVQDALISAETNVTKLKLTASEHAALGDATLRIVGVSTIEGEVVERTLQAKHIGADSEGHCVGPRMLDRLTLTINHKQPFRLFCSEAYQYAHRGSVFLYPMEVDRMNGFTGPITLQIGDRQNRDLDGIEMFEVTMPADSTAIQLPIYLPETMHINIQSQSQLYAQGYATFRDPHNQQQATLVLAEKRNMLRTLPPVVKLQCSDQQLTMNPGETVEVNLFLERTKNFDGPMQLGLVDVAPTGLTIGQTEISGGETKAVLTIKAAPDWQATPTQLRFRAIGWMDETQLISETSITVQPRSLVAVR